MISHRARELRETPFRLPEKEAVIPRKISGSCYFCDHNINYTYKLIYHT